jgi:hypothetical protein
MSLNARVQSGAGVEALGQNGSLSAWQTVAYGVVEFDMADAGDLAIVNAGQAKSVEWYQLPTIDPGSANEIQIGALSAFAIEFYSATFPIGPAFTPYDITGEVRVAAQSNIPPYDLGTVVAWQWGGGTFSAEGSENRTIQESTRVMVAYEGSPITPTVSFRPGWIQGVTPADGSATWRFRLRALPQAAFGAKRIIVPSPYCVPPFIAHGTNKGTHIFQGHASHPMPLTQSLPFPRRFRTVAYDTTAIATDPQIDARILGGPWRGHMMGATDDGTASASWNIDALLAQVPDPVVIPYTPPPVVGVASSASASLNTGPESAHDGLRFTQFDDTTAGRTEILVEFGEE